ncbi:hypothetical protein V6N13_081452 [Hibiscus sabdariffa]|uniref:Protein BIG GRAIN 1-like B n=1 Tax=Hibiscus sabdariffa TaxID=183260 RepID=A0ABR2DC85_9ROSI
MFRFEKTMMREERYRHKRDNPSFSSSLLDQICRSIDDYDGVGHTKNEDNLKFCKETMQKTACLADKKHVKKEFNNKSLDNDVVFFSSSSSSSDSSYGGFSSSDTESLYGSKTKAPSFVPSRPKPVVRASMSARPEKPLFYEQRQFHHQAFDDHTPKSRAMKIYGNLKKMKQPISPGARLASFINSLFTTGNNNNNAKNTKSKNSSSTSRYDDDVSATRSSVSRSCLSKNTPSTRENLHNGVKRRVRFCPVSVLVDEENRSSGQRYTYDQQGSRLLPVSVPTVWKIGKSPSKKYGDEVKNQVTEKSRRVEEIARELLKEYHQNQNQNQMKTHHYIDKNDDDNDDAFSDSSSDLFELDHLVLMGNNRYREELPVYETTHLETNRAIANGLLL